MGFGYPRLLEVVCLGAGSNLMTVEAGRRRLPERRTRIPATKAFRCARE